MNIFATDINPVICAQQHCDVHVIKMILETAQMLSTAHFIFSRKRVGYRATHINHPCAYWVRSSIQNYKWAYDLFVALLDEYEYRFGRVHKSSEHKKALAQIPPLPDIGLTQFVKAMPNEFRSLSSCASYRRYMRAKLAEWQSRPKPVRTTFTRRTPPAFLLIGVPVGVPAMGTMKGVDDPLSFGHY